MRILTAAAARDLDRLAIERLGLPALVLMENAALGVVDAIGQRFPEVESAAIFCGPGNNGGDGLAVARQLATRGYGVEVFLVRGGRELSGDAAAQLAVCRRLDLTIRELVGENGLAECLEAAREHDLVVDALFGTGLARPLTGLFAALVDGLNSLPLPRLAVDVPSGLSGDGGEATGPHVRAEVTVTFGLPKVAHVFPPAAEAVGELVVTDLGFPPRLADLVHEPAGRLHLLVGEELAALLPARARDSNKGTFGHLLLVAGAVGKAGAASLAARAAVRAGAGLVTAAVPEPIVPIVQLASLESMCLGLPAGAGGALAAGAAEAALGALAAKSAVAVGPGLGQDRDTVEAIHRLVAGLAGLDQGGGGGAAARGGNAVPGAHSPQSAPGAHGADSAQSGNSPDPAQGCNRPDSAQGCNRPGSAQGGNSPDSAQGGNSVKSAQGGNSVRSEQRADSPDAAKGANSADAIGGANSADSAQGTHSSDSSRGAEGADSAQGAQGAEGAEAAQGARGYGATDAARGAGGEVPLVLDADGLNAFSPAHGGYEILAARARRAAAGEGGGSPGAQGSQGSQGAEGAPGAVGAGLGQGSVAWSTVLTPHPGELGRLLGVTTAEIQADRVGAARRAAAATGAVVVLKGSLTLVACPDGTVFVNPTGNPGMATGGTGDVLTGILGGLLAQRLGVVDAACLAVYLHGLAGDLALARSGGLSLAAEDLITSLPAAFAQLAAGSAP